MPNGNRSKKGNGVQLVRLDTYIRYDQSEYIYQIRKLGGKKITVDLIIQEALDMHRKAGKGRV